MTISGVQSYTSTDYGKIASGKRINSAKDDASGLAIANKLESQATGQSAGASNAKDGQNALNVSDGAMAGITDYLQRIKELSVSASSGLKSGSDLQAIQSEIDENLKGIQQIAEGTEYNTKKLLNGSMADMDMATNPDGSGMKIQMANSSLEALGIDGYNVTGDFDMSKIDKALNMVNEARSKNGAQSNALNAAYEYGANSSTISTGAQSRIEDLDIPKAVSEQKKNEVLDGYKLMMQKKEEEQESLVTKIFQ